MLPVRGQKFARKLSFVSIILAQIATVTAASITEQYGAGGVDGLISGFVAFFNAITIVEIASTQGVAIMIGVFAVFYFIELNLVESIFNEIQGRIGSGSSGRATRLTTSEGGYPTGTKGLAAAIAFITSQGFAFVFGLWGTAVIGVIGFLLFFIAKFSLLGGFLGGFVPQSARNGVGRRVENAIAGDNGGESRTDGGAQVQQIQDQIKDMEQELGHVEDLAKGVDQELREIARGEDDLSEMKSRLRDMVSSGKISRDEAQQLSQIIDETNDVEQLEEKVENFVENVIKEEAHIAELEEHISQLEADMEAGEADISQVERVIEEKLQQYKSNYQEIQKELEQLKNRLDRGEMNPQEFEREEQQILDRLQKGERGAKEVAQRAGDILAKAQQIEEEAAEAEQEAQEAESEVQDAEDKIGEVEEPVSREEAEVKDEEKKTSVLPEDDVPSELEAVEKEEEEVASEEEGEVREAEDIAKKEDQIVAVEEQELANIENTLGSQEQDLQRYSQEAQELAKGYERQRRELQELERVEIQEAEHVKRDVTQIIQEMGRIGGNLRNGNIDMSEQEILREVKAAEQRLQELKQEGVQESSINEAEVRISNIRKHLGVKHQEVDDAVQKLEQLTQEVGSSNRKPDQIYSEASQVLNQIDRSKLPTDEANKLGKAERNLVDALQAQGMDIKKLP